MNKFYLTHTTIYSYSNPIVESANKFYLYPYNDEKQQVVNHKLTISDNPSIYSYLDNFNNRVGFFSHNPPHDKLVIKSEAEIILKKTTFPEDNINVEEQWFQINELHKELNFLPFMIVENFSAKGEFQKIINNLKEKNDSVLSLARKLCHYVYENLIYKKGVTNVFTTIDQVWKIKSGVCQDFTNVYIQLCRLAHIPTRYVSGYVYAREGILGAGATHAWAEVFIPSFGWIGLDSTNNCIVNDDHIRLAVGRNYGDCTPVKGVFKGNEKQQMNVSVYLDTVPKVDDEKLISEVGFDKSFSKGENLKNSYREQLEIIQQQQQ